MTTAAPASAVTGTPRLSALRSNWLGTAPRNMAVPVHKMVDISLSKIDLFSLSSKMEDTNKWVPMLMHAVSRWDLANISWPVPPNCRLAACKIPISEYLVLFFCMCKIQTVVKVTRYIYSGSVFKKNSEVFVLCLGMSISCYTKPPLQFREEYCTFSSNKFIWQL